MKLIFCMQIIMKVSYKLIPWFWLGWSSIPKVPKIASLLFCQKVFTSLYNMSQKKLKMKLIFLDAGKRQSFLQVDFNILGMIVSYCKMILSLLRGVMKWFMDSSPTYISPMNSSPKIYPWRTFPRMDNRYFPEWTFPKRTVPRMTFARTDISPNHIFIIYLNLYLPLVYKSRPKLINSNTKYIE